MINKCSFRLLPLLICAIATSAAFAQTTTFTYQGRLLDAGNLANGLYDLQFQLFNDTDTQQGATLTLNHPQSPSGIFTVHLYIGDVFDGSPRTLESAFRPVASTDAFTTLSPRQPL